MSCITGLHQLLYYILQLFAQEYGNDCRWCFISSQSVIITRISCGFTKQCCVFIYCF